MLPCATAKPFRVSLVEPGAYLKDSYFIDERYALNSDDARNPASVVHELALLTGMSRETLLPGVGSQGPLGIQPPSTLSDAARAAFPLAADHRVEAGRKGALQKVSIRRGGRNRASDCLGVAS
jgi:hypothetical protein